jgi:hypothetical protein
VDKLSPGARGLYAVRTRSAQYLLDLDAATVTRYPLADPGAEDAAQLRRDGEELALIAVLACERALPMGLLVHGAGPAGVVTYRQTTTVRSIERLR